MPSHSTQSYSSSRSHGLDYYADSLNVSSDGLKAKVDADYRSQMLKSIAKAHDNKWIKY